MLTEHTKFYITYNSNIVTLTFYRSVRRYKDVKWMSPCYNLYSFYNVLIHVYKRHH